MSTETKLALAIALASTADRLEALAAGADAEGSEDLDRAARVLRSYARQVRNLALWLAESGLGGAS